MQQVATFHEYENLLAVHHQYPLTGEVTVWQVPHSCKSNIEEVTYEAMTLGEASISGLCCQDGHNSGDL